MEFQTIDYVIDYLLSSLPADSFDIVDDHDPHPECHGLSIEQVSNIARDSLETAGQPRRPQPQSLFTDEII